VLLHDIIVGRMLVSSSLHLQGYYNEQAEPIYI